MSKFTLATGFFERTRENILHIFWTLASWIQNDYVDAEHGRKSRVIMRQRTEGGQPGNVSCHLCQSRNNKLFVFRALQYNQTRNKCNNV